MSTPRFDDETLMAYADGELDAATRERIAAAAAADAGIAARIAMHAALRTRLRDAFDPVTAEPVPDRLVNAIRGPAVAHGSREVASLEGHRARRQEERRRWSWPEWGSLAASLVIGVMVGQFAMRSPTEVTARGGALLADGPLAAALTEQLAGAQGDDAAVLVGISFLSRSGDYCRTFEWREDSRLAGLACREEAGWRLRVLSEVGAQPVPAGNLRMASAALPAAVLATVEAEIDGEPLDAQGEAAARDSGWR